MLYFASHAFMRRGAVACALKATHRYPSRSLEQGLAGELAVMHGWYIVISFRCIAAGKAVDEAQTPPRSASRLPAASHERLEKTHDNAVSFIVASPAGLGDAAFDKQALCRIALQPFV